MPTQISGNNDLAGLEGIIDGDAQRMVSTAAAVVADATPTELVVSTEDDLIYFTVDSDQACWIRIDDPNVDGYAPAAAGFGEYRAIHSPIPICLGLGKQTISVYQGSGSAASLSVTQYCSTKPKNVPQ